jgi:hypothetical protein
LSAFTFPKEDAMKKTITPVLKMFFFTTFFFYLVHNIDKSFLQWQRYKKFSGQSLFLPEFLS